MLDITDDVFEVLISEAMDSLPEKYVKGLDNVLVTYEDEPTNEQRNELELRGNQSLFGLYQGVPRTQRGIGYNMVLPDKITLFKKPILSVVSNMMELRGQIRRTIWHEIAHHYGLDHDQIHSLE